jgi:hypothetical protein
LMRALTVFGSSMPAFDQMHRKIGLKFTLRLLKFRKMIVCLQLAETHCLT